MKTQQELLDEIIDKLDAKLADIIGVSKEKYKKDRSETCKKPDLNICMPSGPYGDET